MLRFRNPTSPQPSVSVPDLHFYFFPRQAQAFCHTSVIRVGKLLCKEALLPSENPVVILQVNNEDSGGHWGCLWNVKQSGFHSGCLAAAASVQ